jgi:hypothetical protein
VPADTFAGIRVLGIRESVLRLADAAPVSGRITTDALPAGLVLLLAPRSPCSRSELALRRLRAFEAH